MSKRVANKKGQPTRNRAYGRLKLKQDIQKALDQKRLDAQTEAEAKARERKNNRVAKAKPTFRQRAREFFTGKVFNRGRRS